MLPVRSATVALAGLLLVLPMMSTAPSFSNTWLPTPLPAMAPVRVQSMALDWAVNVLVALTKIGPWLTRVSSLVYGPAPLAVSLSVQVVAPVPVAWFRLGGMAMSSDP